MKKQDKKLSGEDLKKLEELIKKILLEEKENEINSFIEKNKFIETIHVEKFSPVLEPIKRIKQEDALNDLEEVASAFHLAKKPEEKEKGYKKSEKKDKYNPMESDYFSNDYKLFKEKDLIQKPPKFKTEEKKYRSSSR